MNPISIAFAFLAAICAVLSFGCGFAAATQRAGEPRWVGFLCAAIAALTGALMATVAWTTWA